MPNTSSAKKRLRQNVDRNLENRIVRTSLRKQLRKVREAVEAGNVESAENEYREAAKRLDRAKAKNIIHANKASRLKSRLQQLIKKAKAA